MDTADWKGKASYFDFQGHQIAYWTGGSSSAKPLLLVHGFPTCAFDWAPTWEALGEDHRLIACDMLGFGLSDKPTDFEGTPQAHAANLTALIEALQLTNVTLVVHDFGGARRSSYWPSIHSPDSNFYNLVNFRPIWTYDT